MPSHNVFNGRGIWIEDKDELLYQLSLESYLIGDKSQRSNWQAYLRKDLLPSQIGYVRTLGSKYEGAEAAVVAAYVSGKLDDIEQIIIIDSDDGDEEMKLFENRGYKLIYDGHVLKEILDTAKDKETPESLTRKLHLRQDKGMVSHKQLQFSELKFTYGSNSFYVIDYVGKIPDELIREMIDIALVSVTDPYEIGRYFEKFAEDSLISDLELKTRKIKDIPLMFLYAIGIASNRETYFAVKRAIECKPSVLASALYWHSSLLFHASNDPQYKNSIDLLRRFVDMKAIALEILGREFNARSSNNSDELSSKVCEMWADAVVEIQSESFYTDEDDMRYCADIRAIAKALDFDQMFSAYDEGVPVDVLLA